MSITHRRIVALGASAAVGVLVLVAIAMFGVRDVPGYPSLADAPDPTVTGWVAYGVAGSVEPSPCIEVVAAGGGVPRRITCNAGGPFGWSANGMLEVYAMPITGSPFTITRYDPATGVAQAASTTSTPPSSYAYGNPRRADGALLAVSPHRVTVGTGAGLVTILEAKDAPDEFAYQTARWSPDGRWVLVLDSTQRLLLVATDGAGSARVVATRVTYSFAWWQPGT